MNDILALLCTSKPPNGQGMRSSEFSQLLTLKTATALIVMVLLQPAAAHLGPHHAVAVALFCCGIAMMSFGTFPQPVFMLTVCVAYAALQTVCAPVPRLDRSACSVAFVAVLSIASQPRSAGRHELQTKSVAHCVAHCTGVGQPQRALPNGGPCKAGHHQHGAWKRGAAARPRLRWL